MHPASRINFAFAACMGVALPSWGQQISMICSTQAEHCCLVATVFARSPGIEVSFVHIGSSEAQAQLNAERANPKTDLWFGGSSAERKRLIERWEKESNSSPKS